MRLFGFFILLFYTFSAIGQTNSNVPIGVWRTHLSTASVATVSVANNKIYAASVKSSFTYDISDNHVASLSKIDGLTQSDIEVIRFNKSTNTGLIGYSNGNIDIIKNGSLSNFDVIFRSNVAGSKKINNITLYDQVAFISCDYGVTVIDLKRNEVIESWMNLRAGGLPNIVYGATLNANQDSIFLATEYGLMSGRYNKPGVNLMDFTNWKVYTNISTTGINSVGELNGRVYAGVKQTGVFVLTGSTWQNIGLTIDAECWNLVNSNNKLLVCAGSKLFSIQNATTYSAVGIPSYAGHIHDAVYDQSGSIWMADLNNGLIKLDGTNDSQVSLNGPFSNKTFNLYYYKNTMLANSGGYDNAFARNYNADGFYEFQDQNQWVSYYRYNSNFPDGFSDNVVASYNSFDDTLYIGSFGDGMVAFKKPNTFVKINTTNSPLKSNYVTGLDTDEDGTLWITTYKTPQFSPSLYSKTKAGAWSSYTMNTAKVENLNLLQIKIDSFGNKWMRFSGNEGMMIFDNKTYQQRYFTTGATGGNLPSNKINCIEIDRKGVVWVGSDQGIAGFYDPSRAFSSSFVAPIYNGFGVLFDKSITCIKTDGGNRKWVGTTEGLWLFNDNFTEAIHFFTTVNSPLYSNYIISIDIHPLTGEVFIATDQGMISYRSDATVSETTDFSGAKIFPNPVRPGFSGVVAIEGLQDNVMVKITDMQGKLFYETRSNGGTATWNLVNYAGVRAETGMYLVFATTEKGEQKFVGKIAIIQ
ncbi:two-component regulator propeller domain-containing protein [Cytophaga aurantiaca]|uniref:type IX secretion system anionic LPS delivery protein PorZ n=1 Tax=Cytophaga aurantiaca TaxID=29530 RepID=UPI000378BBBB|nr:two-component regulator propeller domain-containing protein [Cytophaga aurantiaca]